MPHQPLESARSARSAWPAIAAAWLAGLLEWLALSRSRSADALAAARQGLKRG
jgi:hypothetical protein